MPEFLQYGFMHRAFAAGVVTALICPAIGVFLIPRRLSLIADTLAHVALAGDRGMLTKARIKDDVKPAGLDWITALRGPSIRALMARGAIQPTLFDHQDMAEITHPDYPGERLIACHNPFLEAERARKRGELLDATEAELEKIAAPTSNN